MTLSVATAGTDRFTKNYAKEFTRTRLSAQQHSIFSQAISSAHCDKCHTTISPAEPMKALKGNGKPLHYQHDSCSHKEDVEIIPLEELPQALGLEMMVPRKVSEINNNELHPPQVVKRDKKSQRKKNGEEGRRLKLASRIH